MTNWVTTYIESTECPECGADLTGLFPDPESRHWIDEATRDADNRAFAYTAHMHEAHRVLPELGDLVTYSWAWNGRILTSEVYRVGLIRENDDATEFARRMGAKVEPRYVTQYGLSGLTRRDQGCTPATGDDDRPVIFTIVKDAPPVEGDLFDLLDGWQDEEEDYS